MNRHTGRRLAVPFAVVPLVLLAAACGPADVAGTASPADQGTARPSSPAAPSTSATPDPTPTSSGSAPGPESTGHSGTVAVSTRGGCPAGGAAIPKGAGTARTADLDGDGRADTIWLADVGQRRTLGVRTASGAGFSTVFTSSAPQNATAVAGDVQGGRIVLLNTGRSVALYAVTGCRLVPAQNTQGQQYTFDLGFTGFGTGVGCPVLSGTRQLAGYLAQPGAKDDDETVTRTTVVLSSGGSLARNGTATVLGRHLATDAPLVQQAHTVTCGSGGRAEEPLS